MAAGSAVAAESAVADCFFWTAGWRMPQVLPSSGDMFVFFRNSMVQCAALSTGEPLFNLYGVFKKALRCGLAAHMQAVAASGVTQSCLGDPGYRSYCDQILSGNLPKASSLAQLLLKEAEVCGPRERGGAGSLPLDAWAVLLASRWSGGTRFACPRKRFTWCVAS